MPSFTAPFTRVESSTIRAVAYDPAELVLAVEFSSGGQYRYYGVSREHVTMLLDRDRNGGSIGKYFQSAIKGKFECKKVNPATGEAEPITPRLASPKQIDFIRRLAMQAELWSGAHDARVSAVWGPLCAAGGGRVVGLAQHNPLVETFLAALHSDEAGSIINFLKEQTS